MKAPIAILLLIAAGLAQAQSDVFVCVGENGTREYRNTGNTRGCKRVDLQEVSMIASPYKKPAGPPAPARSGTQTASAKPSSPSDFPRVESSVQKARDNDRMLILSDELKAEEKKLAQLRQEYNNGEPERRGDERNYQKYLDRVAGMKEDIARSERNVEALKREIGNLK